MGYESIDKDQVKLAAKTDQFSAGIRDQFEQLSEIEQIGFIQRLAAIRNSHDFEELRTAPNDVIGFILDCAASKLFELATAHECQVRR